MKKTPYPLNGLVEALMAGAAPAFEHLAACGWRRKRSIFDMDFLNGTMQNMGEVADEPGVWNAVGFLQTEFLAQLEAAGISPAELLAARCHFWTRWPWEVREGRLRKAPETLPGECHLALVMADGSTQRGCAKQTLTMPKDLPRIPGQTWQDSVRTIQIDITWPRKPPEPREIPPPTNPALLHEPPQAIVHPAAENGTAALSVFFLDCKAGWVYLVLNDGVSSRVVNLSDVFDPFEDFIAWMETIAGSAASARWVVDEEGHEETLHFEADPTDGCFGTLTLTGSYQPENKHLQARVSRRQLVDAFYNGFKQLIESPLYNPPDWEGATFASAFLDICGDRYSRLDIERFVRERNTAVLEMLFADAGYVWWRAFEENGEAVQRRSMFTAALAGQSPDYIPMYELKLQDFVFSSTDYEALTVDEQLAKRLERLDEPIDMGYRGTNLRTLHSPLVEQWLRQKAE